MSDLAKKVPEHYELFFGEKVISLINNIKASQEALQDSGWRTQAGLRTQKTSTDSQKTKRIGINGTTTITNSHIRIFKKIPACKWKIREYVRKHSHKLNTNFKGGNNWK